MLYNSLASKILASIQTGDLQEKKSQNSNDAQEEMNHQVDHRLSRLAELVQKPKRNQKPKKHHHRVQQHHQQNQSKDTKKEDPIFWMNWLP